MGLYDFHIRAVVPKIDLGTHKDATLDVYFIFLILGGHIGLPLSLATMYMTKDINRRHPTLINLLCTWILYATAGLILLYSGEQRAESPKFGVCLVQASLIYGTTVAVGCATLCLVVQLWMEFKGKRLAKESRICTSADFQLILLPWLSFLLVGLSAFGVGFARPSLVSIQWVFYCTITSNAIIYAVEALTLVFLALTLVFEVIVLHTLYKATRQFRAVNQSSCHLMYRVTAFTCYSLFTFIISIVLTLNPKLVFAYMFIGTLPLAAFFIFGTQKENLRVWFRVCQQRKEKRHIHLAPMTFKMGVITPTGSDSTHVKTLSQSGSMEKRLPLTPHFPLTPRLSITPRFSQEDNV